jgi:hypothetical protein
LIASLHRASISSVSAETTCELDSHADTSVAGSNFILLEEPTRYVDVYGFAPELPPIKKMPIATAGTAWVDPVTGRSILLILNECLYMGDSMKHSLLNPHQIHCNGLIVQDTPTMFDPSSTHSIYDPASRIRIPLKLNGVISFFPSYAPTLEEAEKMQSISLTSTANWAAVSAAFPNQQRISKVELSLPYYPTQQHNYTLLETSDDCDLHAHLVAAVNIHPRQYSELALDVDKAVYPNVDGRIAISALSTEEKRAVLSPEVLAKRWGIGLNAANATLLNTTQDGVRNVFLPSEHKVRKKTPWMNFPSLKGDCYTDQMFSKVPLVHNHTGGSVFTNGLGYDHFYP